HDFLTVGAAHPLQIAVASALRFPPSFYDALQEEYRERRMALVDGLRECGFDPNPPAGAYYVMVGIDALTSLDDVAFADHLVRAAGSATEALYRRRSHFRSRCLRWRSWMQHSSAGGPSWSSWSQVSWPWSEASRRLPGTSGSRTRR